MLSLKKSALILSTAFTSIVGLNYIFLKKTGNFSQGALMNNTMGTIYIVFAILKLIDLKKFATIFQKYDIISKNAPIYAYVYPFIELFMGISFLKKYKLNKLHISSILLMSISIVSVVLSMINGEKLRCGCLGSFFHIPLSYVTLSENFVMIAMSTMHFLPSST